jgi:DNA-binding response OmpR family regulator
LLFEQVGAYPMAARGKPRILVVEDDAVIALDLERALGGAGYDVLGPVHSVALATSLLDDEMPDAAVLDILLGDEEVFPVARRLDERGIPFLFLTGHGGEHLPPDLADNLCLMKPFRNELMVDMLAGLLEPDD